MTKYFTVIGSRDTPEEKVSDLADLAEDYIEAGWIGRSGGANGADQALEYVDPFGEFSEIYLPWSPFNGCDAGDYSYIDASKLPMAPRAGQIASETHPAWERCTRGARALHTRNVFQIFGKALQEPSKCVICYAEPVGKKGYVKGGTATAVKLAIDNGIPVFNLYNESAYEEALRFIYEN